MNLWNSTYYIWYQEQLLIVNDMKDACGNKFIDCFLFVRNPYDHTANFYKAREKNKQDSWWNMRDIDQVPKEFLLALTLEGIL